jgi:hypothetical protein
LTIKNLVKVGHSGISGWDNYSFRPCSHFSTTLAASFFWRALREPRSALGDAYSVLKKSRRVRIVLPWVRT